MTNRKNSWSPNLLLVKQYCLYFFKVTGSSLKSYYDQNCLKIGRGGFILEASSLCIKGLRLSVRRGHAAGLSKATCWDRGGTALNISGHTLQTLGCLHILFSLSFQTKQKIWKNDRNREKKEYCIFTSLNMTNKSPPISSLCEDLPRSSWLQCLQSFCKGSEALSLNKILPCSPKFRCSKSTPRDRGWGLEAQPPASAALGPANGSTEPSPSISPPLWSHSPSPLWHAFDTCWLPWQQLDCDAAQGACRAASAQPPARQRQALSFTPCVPSNSVSYACHTLAVQSVGEPAGGLICASPVPSL